MDTDQTPPPEPTPEPPPTPEKVYELVKQWISRFERAVRMKSYTLCPMLFHPNVVWMGIDSNITSGLEQTMDQEFRSLWPGTLSFTVDFARAKIVPEGGTLIVIAPWMYASLIKGAPQKHGRLTVILGVFPGGKILCLHGHQSLNPITRILP